MARLSTETVRAQRSRGFLAVQLQLQPRPRQKAARIVVCQVVLSQLFNCEPFRGLLGNFVDRSFPLVVWRGDRLT
ncbi:MAG: hypothetical protein CMJ50_06015 [Planctomycetaceae bacterium]|nr:hypothetical protein [Planctomycetaceae bacterium]